MPFLLGIIICYDMSKNPLRTHFAAYCFDLGMLLLVAMICELRREGDATDCRRCAQMFFSQGVPICLSIHESDLYVSSEYASWLNLPSLGRHLAKIA